MPLAPAVQLLVVHDNATCRRLLEEWLLTAHAWAGAAAREA